MSKYIDEIKDTLEWIREHPELVDKEMEELEERLKKKLQDLET